MKTNEVQRMNVRSVMIIGSVAETTWLASRTEWSFVLIVSCLLFVLSFQQGAAFQRWEQERVK